MIYSRLLLTVAAALLPACGLATGTVMQFPNRTRSISGGTTCTNYAGRVGRCGADFSQNKTSYEGWDYDTDVPFGVDFHYKYGKHSSKSGDMESSGTMYDLGLEFTYHTGRLAYTFEIGTTRKQLPDFGDDYRATAYHVLPRVQYNAGVVAPYVGLGYLAMGFYDLPSGFGTEASGYRIVGGLRAGVPIGASYFDGVFVTLEVQRDAARDGVDFTSLGFLGALSVDLSP